MSDAPIDQKFRLDLDDTVARIERQQAETRKFVAEMNKLTEEALKFRRDRWLAPVVAVASVLAAVGALVAGVIAVAKQAGWLP
jgi:hypothetical protein